MSKVFNLCSAAAILAATGAFAQMRGSHQQNQNQNPCACMEQGMGLPTDKKCFPAAYNAPAAINVSCGWDFDVFGSFIYWHTSEEGLDMAYVTPTHDATPVPGAVSYQDFTYKPGFQVGIGFNTGYDDWAGWVEYTWLHQSETTAQTAPTLPGGAAGTWTGSDWFVAAATAPTVSSTWKMHLDMLDAFFSRPYYQGTQLTVAPYAGIRALWIRQAFNVNLNPYASNNKSNSWAIGPTVGTKGHWMLGCGFRFDGNAAASLLYTQYTTIAWSEVNNAANKTTAGTTNYGTVRPVAQLGAGLGWGTYMYCQKYYFDLSARYDFNYFWNQNVMRPFASELVGRENDRGDLTLHGLTVTARFDF